MFKKPLARKAYSDHPADNFLEIVLHQNFKGEYVTHVLNKQTGGFAHGHYFGRDLTKAILDFNARGVPTLLNTADTRVTEQKQEIAALLETIKQQTFALETAVNLGGGLSPVVRQELGKYAAIGQKVLKENGIDY